ncbi:hypothetical protein ASPZODRAFT_61111 [Penicilliopsis zonata CBS 506.65]|uniref:Uncharacterized protein n=1 Tax=Penicilliopsis zonata CBS 506.65 TaxID=1073090 RepID=A0A1L9SQ97_9EURO|nr:hypothetical protein ASPZODRAFT_61111 [Penicilliopsis zonata CBS 506.65]OJJ49338.1 hypothetical protein ASPZODRAFT_61111 [Penicilliopsis zonata CBS 506.65]
MSSKAVNRPTDSKQKEKDINQKLQLYGIYQGFKNGKLPSNKQCDVALNSALNSRALSSPSKDLSEEGQHLVKDLRDVIEQAKKLMLSKNHDEILQDFIYSTQSITSGDAERPNVPIEKESAQQDGTRAMEGLKTLGNLLITNGEFRKLLSDATILIRDIAGDASQKAADRVRPSEEQLAQVDQPAEENVWHEKPNLSKDELKARFKNRANENKPAAAANKAAQASTGGQQPTSASDIDFRGGAVAGYQNLKETTSENVPEETKNRTRELADRTKNYLSQKMPQERRDQVIWRLKKMVLECQSHADYQQAIETLLELAEKYAGHTKDYASQGSGAVKDVRAGGPVQQAETNLRILIERFANGTSMDDFFDSLNNIYKDADQDPELKSWFRHLDSYIRKCLQEQGFILKEEANTEWNQLYDNGRFLLRERYRGHTDHILDEIKFLADQFNQDPQNRAFGDAVQRLFLDLGKDADGKPAFKKHLLVDIRDVILPAIFENVRYVPIPRIEVSDPMADVVVENLVIESDNLMPNVMEFGSDNYFRWGRKKISNKNDHKIMISLSGIQADLRDVSYYIKKKQGFPSLTDTGVMDIFLGGEGFSCKIAASSAQKSDSQHFMKIDKVNVKISNMDIKLRKSKHKILFTLFKPMLFKIVRPILQKVLEKQVREAFNKGDAFMYEIHTESQRAAEAARNDPENAPNIYSRYADATRAKLTERKKKAEAVAQRDTKIQFAATHADSMFPDIKLPGGISNKATEYSEIAKKGERWSSPIFSIGSASTSKDIPKQPAVTRKPHATAEGRLRDRPANGSAVPNGGLVSNGGLQVVNGGAGGYGGYPSRGFSDEVEHAFENGSANGVHGKVGGLDGAATVTGSLNPQPFNPQNI